MKPVVISHLGQEMPLEALMGLGKERIDEFLGSPMGNCFDVCYGKNIKNWAVMVNLPQLPHYEAIGYFSIGMIPCINWNCAQLGPHFDRWARSTFPGEKNIRKKAFLGCNYDAMYLAFAAKRPYFTAVPQCWEKDFDDMLFEVPGAQTQRIYGEDTYTNYNAFSYDKPVVLMIERCID